MTSAVDGCRAVTRSTSAHPGDWGRAIALALEYLAVQVAFTVREPEPGVLLGHDVRLRFEGNGGGVVIEASIDHSVIRAPFDASATEIDQLLVARILTALEGCRGIDTSGIAIAIAPGGVILRGELASVDDRNSIVRTVLRVPGVQSVGDELDTPSPHYSRAG